VLHNCTWGCGPGGGVPGVLQVRQQHAGIMRRTGVDVTVTSVLTEWFEVLRHAGVHHQWMMILMILSRPRCGIKRRPEAVTACQGPPCPTVAGSLTPWQGRGRPSCSECLHFINVTQLPLSCACAVLCCTGWWHGGSCCWCRRLASRSCRCPSR
jgi:hypothetical protein